MYRGADSFDGMVRLLVARTPVGGCVKHHDHSESIKTAPAKQYQEMNLNIQPLANSTDKSTIIPNT